MRQYLFFFLGPKLLFMARTRSYKRSFWYIHWNWLSSKYLLIIKQRLTSILLADLASFCPNNLLNMSLALDAGNAETDLVPDFRAHRQTSSDQNVLQVGECVWGWGGGYDGIKGGGVLGKDKETQKSFQEIWGLSCCYWSTIARICKGMLVSSSMEHSGSKSFAISGAPTESSALDFQGHPLRIRQKQAVKSQPFPMVSGLWEHSDAPHGNCGFIKIKADWWAQALRSVCLVYSCFVPLWPCFLMEMHFSLTITQI